MTVVIYGPTVKKEQRRELPLGHRDAEPKVEKAPEKIEPSHETRPAAQAPMRLLRPLVTSTTLSGLQ